MLAVALTATACAGGEPSSSAAPTGITSPDSATATTLLEPAAFAEAVADDGTFVVNVHVPDEGSIAGTDTAIPYDRLQERAAELPSDRDAPVAVYCRTGRMSALAVQTLEGLGYTDVVELSGGMAAWTADGRDLLPPEG